MASDLRAIVTAIRLTSEIERSGDLMVNVAKATRRLYGAAIPPALHGLLAGAWPTRPSASSGWPSTPTPTATPTWPPPSTTWTTGSTSSTSDYIQAILELYADVRDVQAAVQLALVGRYYERIGDHAVNIGERVQYMVTGWLPEHTGAARLAAGRRRDRRARPRDRRPRRRWCVVLAVALVAGASSASSASPGGCVAAGRRLSTTSCPTGTGLAEATSVVERAVDRTLLRGGEGSRGRGPAGRARSTRSRRASWCSTTPASIVYRNDVAAGLPRRPARRGAGRGGHRRAGRGGADGRQRRSAPHGRPVRAAPPDARARRPSRSQEDGAPARRARGHRRRHRPAPARGGAPRLRRQHQPRAEDAGRRARRCWPRRSLAEDDPAVAQRLAERMLAEAFRVGRTIDDLLELSRIEADEEARRDDGAGAPGHRRGRRRVRPGGRAAGASPSRSRSRRRGSTVAGDRRQLVSAIYNLLENAVKYSDDGLDASRCGRAPTAAGSTSRCEDHGIGIPRRDLERVFERFYRVDRARSRETGGTGLGLAIVRHVASNHAGEVRVESAEGEGSTFTLRLPVGAGPVAVTAEAG